MAPVENKDGWFAWITGATDAEPTPKEREERRTLRHLARKSVDECRIDDIFDQSKDLEKEVRAHRGDKGSN